MPVYHDYLCKDCDEVILDRTEHPESCPDCRSRNIAIAFLKPPGIKSVKTKNADTLAKDLAQAYDMPDINTNPSTSHGPRFYDSPSEKVKNEVTMKWQKTDSKIVAERGGKPRLKKDKLAVGLKSRDSVWKVANEKLPSLKEETKFVNKGERH